MSEPVSIETRVSRNTNDIEVLYGLIQEFAGRTRANFARVDQRFDDLESKVDGLESKVDGLEGKVDGIAGQLAVVTVRGHLIGGRLALRPDAGRLARSRSGAGASA